MKDECVRTDCLLSVRTNMLLCLLSSVSAPSGNQDSLDPGTERTVGAANPAGVKPGECNAVCNEKYKQGTAVKHDKYVFPLEGVTLKKIQKNSAGPVTRLMFSYIG